MFVKDINLDENILRTNRIPLLIQEAEWIKLFGESKNKGIQDAKEELIKLITRNNVLESCSLKLQKNKTEYMKMILEVSDSINNEKNINGESQIELLDQYKEKILEINEEIEETRFQLEMLPRDIREANFQLLKATVQYGYSELKNKEKVLDKSLKEIQGLRERLKELVQIKHDNEEWINETYTFLHGILGNEVIEEIDRQKLK